MNKWKAWIDGERVDAESGETYPVLNPATEEELAQVPLCAEADARKAVESARRAFPVWSRRTQGERSGIILQFAGKLRTHATEIAVLDASNHGSPIRLAFDAVVRAAESLERIAEAGITMMEGSIPTRLGGPFYLRHRPLGVCALVVPWNASFSTTIDRIASAVAIGNTCVIRPPSATPLVALRIGEILQTIGIPRGTVSILSGPDYTLGGAIAFHPGVDRASFDAAERPARSMLFSARETVCARAPELGDRNRFVILEDADLDSVVPRAIIASFSNAGATFPLPGRYYVHDRLYDEFTERFISAAGKIVVGDPACEATEMGPIVTALHRDRVERFIGAGIGQGASLATGGRRPRNAPLDRGYFMTPAVFVNVSPGMSLTKERVYGPVASILRISPEEDVPELVHRFSLDLGASVWTGNPDRASAIARAAQGGVIWINDHLVLSKRTCDEFEEGALMKTRSFLALEANAQLILVSPDVSATMVGDVRLNRN